MEDFVEGMFRLHECYSLNREYIANRARRIFNYKIMAQLYIMAYENIIGIYKGGLLDNQELLHSALLNSRIQIENEWRRMANIDRE